MLAMRESPAWLRWRGRSRDLDSVAACYAFTTCRYPRPVAHPFRGEALLFQAVVGVGLPWPELRRQPGDFRFRAALHAVTHPFKGEAFSLSPRQSTVATSRP